MSDLAPFVAATIRDKCVEDLQAENQRLRTDGETVEITNEQGTRVYARGRMTEGSPGGGGERWQIQLEQLEPCPLADINMVQIKLGGIPLIESGSIDRKPCHVLNFVAGCFEFDTKLGLFEFNFERTHQSVGHLEVRCGPFETMDEYEDTDDGFGRENPFFCRDLRDQAVDYPESVVEFRSIALNLPQMLPYLARFGISEDCATRTPELPTKGEPLPAGWYYDEDGRVRVNRNYPDPENMAED